MVAPLVADPPRNNFTSDNDTYSLVTPDQPIQNSSIDKFRKMRAQSLSNESITTVCVEHLVAKPVGQLNIKTMVMWV